MFVKKILCKLWVSCDVETTTTVIALRSISKSVDFCRTGLYAEDVFVQKQCILDASKICERLDNSTPNSVC